MKISNNLKICVLPIKLIYKLFKKNENTPPTTNRIIYCVKKTIKINNI